MLKGLLMGLIWGVIGVVIAAIRSRSAENSEKQNATGMWKCPRCGAENRTSQGICPGCGEKRPMH